MNQYLSLVCYVLHHLSNHPKCFLRPKPTISVLWMVLALPYLARSCQKPSQSLPPNLSEMRQNKRIWSLCHANWCFLVYHAFYYQYNSQLRVCIVHLEMNTKVSKLLPNQRTRQNGPQTSKNAPEMVFSSCSGENYPSRRASRCVRLTKMWTRNETRNSWKSSQGPGCKEGQNNSAVFLLRKGTLHLHSHQQWLL